MYKYSKIKFKDLQNEREENIYVNAMLNGFFWGFLLSMFVWMGIYFIEYASAEQTNITATVLPNLCNSNIEIIKECCGK